MSLKEHIKLVARLMAQHGIMPVEHRSHDKYHYTPIVAGPAGFPINADPKRTYIVGPSPDKYVRLNCRWNPKRKADQVPCVGGQS